MNTLNLRLTVLGVLIACTLAACNQPITTQQTSKKNSGSVERVGNLLYQTIENKRVQTMLTGNSVDDAAMTSKVRSAISVELGLQVLEIQVETVDQMVMLTGTIDSQASRDRASQIASAVAGVKMVENRLKVKPLIWG